MSGELISLLFPYQTVNHNPEKEHKRKLVGLVFPECPPNLFDSCLALSLKRKCLEIQGSKKKVCSDKKKVCSEKSVCTLVYHWISCRRRRGIHTFPSPPPSPRLSAQLSVSSSFSGVLGNANKGLKALLCGFRRVLFYLPLTWVKAVPPIQDSIYRWACCGYVSGWVVPWIMKALDIHRDDVDCIFAFLDSDLDGSALGLFHWRIVIVFGWHLERMVEELGGAWCGNSLVCGK